MVFNEQQFDILKKGIAEWNNWRATHPHVEIHLQKAPLLEIHLTEANLQGADLQGADFSESNLYRVNLQGANLQGANLQGTYLQWTKLQGANLQNADLQEARFQGADLQNAHLEGALMRDTSFLNMDLSHVQGLDEVHHAGPSTIDAVTLMQFVGHIPENFLRGCGIPNGMIESLPGIIETRQPIQFYSCFISYSTKDEDFAKRLHERMQQEHLRVWFAPEDIQGGKKIYEQLEEAIHTYDKLLLVLSDHSIQSEWVTTELSRARQIELKENRRKLFPIRLCNLDIVKAWQCFGTDTGKDLAREVREYHIPDFSNWKDNGAFETAFAKLFRDLKATDELPNLSL